MFWFGKKKTHLTYISSLYDIAECVKESSLNSGMNYPELVGLEDGKVLIPTYDWKSYLEPFFKPVNSISTKHHFRMQSSNLGVVYSKEYDESPEVMESLLRNKCNLPTGFPDIVNPAGLSPYRQKYLYDEIRQFCKEDDKDLVCPMPAT